MSIKILNAGALSTLQDQGRFGYQEYGFSPAGAADSSALRRLNLLLANKPDEAAVEMTMKGFRILFEQNCVFALTGADMKPELNGKAVHMECACSAKNGDILECFTAGMGMYTYFGVHGGFDVKEIMGSRSTSLRFSLGGINGRALKAFDRIDLMRSSSALPNMEKRNFAAQVYPSEVVLRVISGPQDNYFTKEMKQAFLTNTYSVSPKMDRMGIRFDGEALPGLNSTDIISDAIVTGAIQITNEGLPILLMQDRQTTGGYAKIACVITADLSKAAQLRPGNTVRFQEVSLHKAQRLLAKQEKQYQKLHRSLNGERK